MPLSPALQGEIRGVGRKEGERRKETKFKQKIDIGQNFMQGGEKQGVLNRQDVCKYLSILEMQNASIY